jgi:hypothetical protein
MSNLFIRLYLDEDVNVLVADLLKARDRTNALWRDSGCLSSTSKHLAKIISNFESSNSG